jgi:hypothetical protein
VIKQQEQNKNLLKLIKAKEDEIATIQKQNSEIINQLQKANKDK